MATNQLPTICLDSCVLIDCLEKRADRFPFLKPILQGAAAKELIIVVSMFALSEIVKIEGVEPDEQKQVIRDFLENDFIYMHGVDRRVGEISQDIRRSHTIDAGDAVHVATAIATDTPFFLTRDGDGKRTKRKLLPLDKKLSVSGGPLRIMTPADYHSFQVQENNPLFQPKEEDESKEAID